MPPGIAKSSMTWDGPTEHRLLLAILKTSNISIDYAAIAAELTDDNATCTAVAVRRHLDKIRSSDRSGNTKATYKRKLQTRIDSDGSSMAKRVKWSGGVRSGKDSNVEEAEEEHITPVKTET